MLFISLLWIFLERKCKYVLDFSYWNTMYKVCRTVLSQGRWSSWLTMSVYRQMKAISVTSSRRISRSAELYCLSCNWTETFSYSCSSYGWYEGSKKRFISSRFSFVSVLQEGTMPYILRIFQCFGWWCYNYVHGHFYGGSFFVVTDCKWNLVIRQKRI